MILVQQDIAVYHDAWGEHLMAASLLGPPGRTPLGTTALTIGRGLDNHLVLNDNQVSAHHAIIRCESQIYSIADAGSTNGTFVNKQRVYRDLPQSLTQGDVIRVGQTLLTFEVSETALTLRDTVYLPDNKAETHIQQAAPASLQVCPHCGSAMREIARFCHVCGSGLTVLHRLQQGIQIGNYIVDRFLGSGGIGAVYLAHHCLLKQSVALKIHDYFPSNPHISRAFLRSSNYLSQLDHPHIVHLYDYGLQAGKAYQAIEYIHGPTLAQIPWQKTQSWIHDCIEYFMQMVMALGYAHTCTYINVDGILSTGIIHGDIKPHNIFVDRATKKVKLSDFMIPDVQAFLGKKEPDFDDLEVDTRPYGTPAYMAPEQETGQLSAQTDIFSLGITMYQLATGIRPSSEHGSEKLWERVPPMNDNPHIPAWLSDLILKASEIEPADRFQSTREMLHVFQQHRNEERLVVANMAGPAATRDQHVIGQFNNVVASLNVTSQFELANTLKLFKEGIMASTEISARTKQELIEVINQIGEEATRVVPNTIFLHMMSDGLLTALQTIPDASLSQIVQKEAAVLLRIHREQRKMKRAIRILFLAANPKDTPALRLDEEIRGIDKALRGADFRDRFDIKQQWAVRVTDVQDHLLRYKPDIVHFSGHGNSTSEIMLEGPTGNSQTVPARALSQVFSVLKDNIRCVVLNACYSQPQAQAIAQHIDCVIGMSQAVGDVAAVSFAAAFYQALGYGRNIRTAFDLGCVHIDMEGLDEQNIPQLLATVADPANIVFVDNP